MSTSMSHRHPSIPSNVTLWSFANIISAF
jgi:hypothetical protein